MDPMEKEINKQLRNHLKDAPGLDGLIKRIITLPYERVALATEIGITLAASNPRLAMDMLRAAPEVSRMVESGDLRVWGEICKRLSATSADTAADFIRSTPQTLEAIRFAFRSPVLKLVNKQSALSANTALESFKAAPRIIETIGDPEDTAEVLHICLELARHSVKHSNDLLAAAPDVISRLKSQDESIRKRALSLTASFAFRSGSTASEFFSELPQMVAAIEQASLNRLFDVTEEYLERSGGVALQYFKAAGCVLALAGCQSFERWTALARRVALQGNAASYHFMKSSPQIITELASRAGVSKRAEVISATLEVVEQIAESNTMAAVECFKASPIALAAATIAQFRDWAIRGIGDNKDSSRRIQAYYALESKASQEALFRVEGGLMLDAVAHTLRLYAEGLTGRALNVSSLANVPDEAKIGDGKTIYLPSSVSEFESEDNNFRLFKVLAAHAAGQIEFDTYQADTPDLLAALADARSFFKNRNPDDPKSKKDADQSIDFLLVISLYPNRELAIRLFTTIENGRIDFLLRNKYRGIRRDLDFVRERLVERRPSIFKLPEEMIPIEILFQVALCGGATEETSLAWPYFVREIEQIFYDLIFQPDASVADSLAATRRVYGFFTEQPAQSDAENQEGDEGEGQNAGDDAMADPDGEQDEGHQMEVSEDVLSFWSSARPQDALPDQEMINRLNGGQSVEQDLEKGDLAFYYDEWDRELADYRTRWCRIIERTGVRGSRAFVEMVRTRYAGVISSVRYQFQLLRPENLRRIRGEIDGEDFDLQAVIDYALDKRSTGLIDDRLYTRKLRRERDVAVSFLLDMSSSTARTISRNPNQPYTQPGQRIIDIEKEGLVLMSEALEAVGDAYSMQGFTSEGRRNVKFYVFKDFSESYSHEIERRIGGITYQNNTRLGAAIRHATTRLAAQEARTKLLIILSDGRPYDHDYGDSRYAREDTRIALQQSRLERITPFCITIDRESEDQLKDMYGEVGYTIIDDVLSLPERLPGIYSRLTT